MSQTKDVGDSVTFTVAATGLAPLNYQWKKDGIDIPGANTTTHTCTDLKEVDEGNYTCYVTNPIGNATSNPAKLSVYNFILKQTFNDINQYSYSIIMGDINGDNYPDMLLVHLNFGASATPTVWINQGNGTFVRSLPDINIVNFPSELVDLDSDGDRDFITRNSSNSAMEVWINKDLHSGQFEYSHDIEPFGLLKDIDGDNKIDIFCYDSIDSSYYAWINDGNANFTKQPFSIVITGVNLQGNFADVNGDNKIDFFSKTNGAGDTGVKIWFNNSTPGNVTFTASTQTTFGGYYVTHILIGDIDGDNDQDIIIFNGNTMALDIWKNQQNVGNPGIFSFSNSITINFWSLSTFLADIENDGDLDIILFSFISNYFYLHILLNDGTGNFSEYIQPLFQQLGYSPISFLADLDKDNDIDFVTIPSEVLSASCRVWHNVGSWAREGVADVSAKAHPTERGWRFRGRIRIPRFRVSTSLAGKKARPNSPGSTIF